MSEYQMEKIANGTYLLAVWDKLHQTYYNCYIVLQDREAFLIDAGKREHSDILLQGLSYLNRDREDVTAILATHWHQGHVGGCEAFPNAASLIHEYDWSMLTGKRAKHFMPTLPGEGSVLEFDSMILGYHTSGSVALFHEPSKALFIGDHLCFRGAQPEGPLVGEHPELRERARSYVRDLASLEKRFKEQADFFREGLEKLVAYDAEYLCTGHGGVLKGEINPFLQELIELI